MKVIEARRGKAVYTHLLSGSYGTRLLSATLPRGSKDGFVLSEKVVTI